MIFRSCHLECNHLICLSLEHHLKSARWFKAYLSLHKDAFHIVEFLFALHLKFNLKVLVVFKYDDLILRAVSENGVL